MFFFAAQIHSKCAIKTVKTTDKELMQNRAHFKKRVKSSKRDVIKAKKCILLRKGETMENIKRSR